VGKNSGPVLNRLWTKVYEISGQCRRPLVLSNILTQVSISSFIHQIFAIKSRSCLNRTTVSFWPQYFQKGRPQLFYSRLLAWFIAHRLAKFGWVPFADRLRSLAMKWNAKFTKCGWKFTSTLKPLVDQSSHHFEAMWETPCSLQRTSPLMYIMFRSKDIGH